MTQAGKFSIFDPVIAYEHREFYEQIVNEINVILPVCNQGKCLAVEISRNLAEQETIRELMERVERFRGELLDGTKKLFDQFYQSKESFHRMIQSTVAYVKINLIDRNLLERTCDVRWWALETAFCGCIEEFNATRAMLESLADAISRCRADLEAERERLAGTGDGSFWSTLLRRGRGSGTLARVAARLAALTKVAQHLQGVRLLLDEKQGTQFVADAHELAKLYQGADPHGAGHGILDLCRRVQERMGRLRPLIAYACDRLETINAAYTLYRDLVICDERGYIIATSNAAMRPAVQGLNVADEEWFRGAMNTSDGTEYSASDVAPSQVEAQLSLAYSTAIRREGRENNPAIGAMGIFFDFQGEAGIILGDYMPGDAEGGIKEGWCSFFTSKDGAVLASSDPEAVPEGTRPLLPRAHRRLGPGQIAGSYGGYLAQDSALFTAKTDGYLDYAGLGWSSHIVLPRADIFKRRDVSRLGEVDMDELLHARIIPEINKSTYTNVQKDKRALQLISTNGMLFAAELGMRGQALSPVFAQITRTGDFATNCMEDLLREMAADSLSLNFQTLRLFSKQAIDLIDRNLFERSADIRWWATDRYFWEALGDPSEEKFREAGERLKVINNSYTMYRNLVLADASGKVVACSRPAMLGQLRGVDVAGHDWFQQAMQTQAATQYVVQDACRSELEPNKKNSLVYAGGVRAKGAKDGDAVGALGVLFDWDTEARKMLEKCLPRDPAGSVIAGSAAFYTNAAGVVIETTDAEHFPVGFCSERLLEICQGLSAGDAASGFFALEKERYIIGSAKTKGYREYRGLAWTAHVLRPF